MDIELLVNITSKAWSLKILSLLQSGTPGRQAPLLAATKASRSSFASSMEHLVQLGLLERNPGHGHPLRPEFRLTPSGKRAAVIAGRVMENVLDEDAFVVIRRSWAVPILAVTDVPARFSHIKSELGGISDRALSQSLFVLEERAWLKREIDVSHRSPFPTYHAVNAGQKINQAIALNV
ncbi:MAG: transcriptional regulator [Rhodobiaceae bacterium]|nr:transcriptional regulator [Rhodobiaceae bacterium]